MTKHDGRRVARRLATGVMGPATTMTRRVTIPMKIGPSPLPGASAREVGENSPFEKFWPHVKIDPTPEERRVLRAAHLASIALRRTFEHWTKVGAGLQLLRQKADQIGTRNAFNELRDQHRLGDTHLRKEVASRLLKVMDNLKAVESWRATLTEKQRLEWASPDTIIRRCPVFNRPKTATAEAKPSPYAKLEQQHAAALERLHKLEKLEGFLKQDIDVDGDIFLLDAKDKVEVIASKVIEKVGVDKAVKIARAILNSPEHDEPEGAEREQERY